MIMPLSPFAALLAAVSGLAAVQAPAAKNPVVVIETSLGDITVELDRARAPVTVENFLAYARAGFYDGTIFHRVIKGFMIQGGGLTPDMQRKPTKPPIENEAGNGLSNTRGTIAMARTADPHSATSQFFINTADNVRLDRGREGTGGYAVFGRVTAGMDVVDKIESVPTTDRAGHQNVPVEPVVIKRVRIVSR
ncbi:MAG TPA: peptidylprolyl isomerase [Vicinamibacterales bacterium]|nr:peptidylprolyl isomerase [Vicinamibacterales bacterium]